MTQHRARSKIQWVCEGHVSRVASLRTLRLAYSRLLKVFIRPPRAEYDMDALGPQSRQSPNQNALSLSLSLSLSRRRSTGLAWLSSRNKCLLRWRNSRREVEKKSPDESGTLSQAHSHFPERPYRPKFTFCGMRFERLDRAVESRGGRLISYSVWRKLERNVAETGAKATARLPFSLSLSLSQNALRSWRF